MHSNEFIQRYLETRFTPDQQSVRGYCIRLFGDLFNNTTSLYSDGQLRRLMHTSSCDQFCNLSRYRQDIVVDVINEVNPEPLLKRLINSETTHNDRVMIEQVFKRHQLLMNMKLGIFFAINRITSVASE